VALAVRGSRVGIVATEAGITIKNLMSQRTLTWHEIEAFEIGHRDLMANITVVCRDGRRIVADGFKTGRSRTVLVKWIEILEDCT